MVEVIAIDGPASVGKSTLAKKISNKFNSPILFSGRLYRAVALEIKERDINLNNKKEIIKCVKLIDRIKLDSPNLYSSEIDKISSSISAHKYLRDELKEYQRNFPMNYAKKNKYAIIEGRDIGTVIFPEAKYKIFMWADAKIRAKRRYHQILKKGQKVSINRVYKGIIERDYKDINRKVAPLRPAVNSVLLDTTYLDIEQSFNSVIKILDI